MARKQAARERRSPAPTSESAPGAPAWPAGVEEWVGWLDHHDNLFHTRVGFWIAGQSVAAAVVASSSMAKTEAIIASVFGAALTVLWWKTGANIASKHNSMRKRVFPKAFLMEWHGGKEETWYRRAVSSYCLLVHVLPGLFLIAWALLLARSCVAGDPQSLGCQ